MSLKGDAKFKGKLTYGLSCISWHWRMMQILKKYWLLVPKMTWQIWWILMQAVASLKIWILMCYFSQTFILYLSHKSAEELCFITMKNDTKFEEWLICALKNDMRNLANFDPTLKSLKICTLMAPFEQSIYFLS